MSFTISENNYKYIFNSFKTEKFKLPLKVETDQFVICLVLSECLSVKICCISPLDSEANRDGADAESPFPLFHVRTLAEEKRPQNCLCFGTGGPSLCLYPLLSQNIILSLNNNGCAKINFWQSNLHTLSACTIGILSTLTYTEFDCAALLAML